jgi:hypothetical protein
VLVYCDPKTWPENPEAKSYVDLLLRGGPWTPSQEFLDPHTGVHSQPPERPVQMHMGIHSIRNQDRRLHPGVVAVGVHLKYASDFGDYYFDRLSKLMDSPAVTALGEVGMDCSEGTKPFGIQKSTLQWVLALARPYMPLVLHIRASGENPQATDMLCPMEIGPSPERPPLPP